MKNVIMCLAVFVFAILMAITSYSETKITIIKDPPAKEVVVEGKGQDEESALKDAYRKAIERTYGLEVDAHQQMEGDELVKDQLTTRSSAYIAGYEILDQVEMANGFVKVKIKAKVKKTKPKPPKKPTPTVVRVPCPECDGNRYVKIEISCTKCGGAGVMPVYIKSGIGGRRYRTGGGECPTCRGIGKVTRQKACNYCNGTGKVQKQKVESVQRSAREENPASSGFGGQDNLNGLQNDLDGQKEGRSETGGGFCSDD